MKIFYYHELCTRQVTLTFVSLAIGRYLLQCVEQATVGTVFYANNSELLAKAVKQCAGVRTNNNNSHLAPEDIFYRLGTA